MWPLIQGPWSLKQFAVPAWSPVTDESSVTRLLSLGHMVALMPPPAIATTQLSPHGPLELPHTLPALLSLAGIASAAVASCTSPNPLSQSYVATKRGSRSICSVVPSLPMCVHMGLGSLKGDVDLGQGFSEARTTETQCPCQPVPIPQPPSRTEPQVALRR